MSRVVVGRGKARITIDGPDAAELEALVRDALGDAVQVLDDAVEEVEVELKKTWPVFSGKSLAAWERVLVIDPERMEARVSLRSDSPYAVFVKSTKHGTNALATRSRSPVVTDVRVPIQAKKKLIADKLKAALKAALSRKLDG